MSSSLSLDLGGGRPSAPGARAFPGSLYRTALDMVHPGRFPISWPSGWLTSLLQPVSLHPPFLSHPLGFCLGEEMESSHRKCWASLARGAESVFSVDAGANGPLPAHASCCPSLGKGSVCSRARGPGYIHPQLAFTSKATERQRGLGHVNQICSVFPDFPSQG